MRYLSFHCCPENEGAAERRWPYWSELATRLIEQGWFIVCIGTEKDAAYYAEIVGRIPASYRFAIVDVVGQTPGLADVATTWQVLDCKMLVCVNSGVMHVALGVGLPLVAIVGATPARIILPANDPKVRYLEDPALDGYDPLAPNHHHAASRMHEITVDAVMEQIADLDIHFRTFWHKGYEARILDRDGRYQYRIRRNVWHALPTTSGHHYASIAGASVAARNHIDRIIRGKG